MIKYITQIVEIRNSNWNENILAPFIHQNTYNGLQAWTYIHVMVRRFYKERPYVEFKSLWYWHPLILDRFAHIPSVLSTGINNCLDRSLFQLICPMHNIKCTWQNLLAKLTNMDEQGRTFRFKQVEFHLQIWPFV